MIDPHGEFIHPEADGWYRTTTPGLWVCPRCFATVNSHPKVRARHIDWHTGVRDGFHEYREGRSDVCAAEMRNSGGGAFWHCNLPAEHWYHQPLPEHEEPS